MDDENLKSLVNELLDAARSASSGRAARTIQGDHRHALRETVIALRGGEEMAEHESPGEATLQVLAGRVKLIAGDETWEGVAGEQVAIPPRRHSLAAVEDSAVLLTVVKTPAAE